MNIENNVLDAWIMVEHLSEGDISMTDRSIVHWDAGPDYYYGMLSKIKAKRLKMYQKGGVVLYFDIFPFEEIVDFLRKEFHLRKTEQDIVSGYKFSFALYFDKDLKFNSEMTFVSASYFIRKFKQLPDEKTFSAFEEELRKKTEELFECEETENYPAHFNTALAAVLRKNKVEIKNCRMRIVENLETDATNLHSFFVDDLQKAKKSHSAKLKDYILGTDRRINLDSRSDSPEFAREEFWKILNPKYYPIARFPSNPQYALAFMQQVAVNLAIGYDNDQLRSVNGPPGTGKTTLLKDIFAELVVQQAQDIVGLTDKVIKGSEETKYYKNVSIGVMPHKIAEKGIVVASSNNGAVQNIVNELPLLSGIDEEFIDAMNEADYFRNLANAKLGSKWRENDKGEKTEELIIEASMEPDRFWGLFSLEGGKKENVDRMIIALKHIVKYLEEEYKPDSGIYDKFRKKHEEICEYRKNRQESVCEINKLYELNEKIQTLRNEIAALNETKSNKKKLVMNAQDEINNTKQLIEALSLQKPGIISEICSFIFHKGKSEYKQKMKEYSDVLQELLQREQEITNEIAEIEKKLEKNNQAAVRNQKDISLLEKNVLALGIPMLDFSVPYEALQLSNPWFDIEYRRMQSLLFISALKVRKQFLYENRKNVKAAYNIWSKQKNYLEHKKVISEAWNWINMTIPVISSTFASFSRMFAYLEEETIGYLFVDEAGQALAQASVGAMLRSKKMLVVGDPSQIKPVLTLDEGILGLLREHYKVSEKYISENASTQTLVDAAGRYGFYKDREKEDWIGIPLWVHRRCKHPMFDIANEISYGGNMVQGAKKWGMAAWYDISGEASDKYVAEQGAFLREKILEISRENPEVLDQSKKDVIYVISPFKNVADKLSQELKKIRFTRYDNGKPTNVGTVHTFQGKEAPIVFLVLGADEKSKGAANWAMGTENPNIMNVAATRAKEEFYVIGSRKLYQNLDSDVIKITCCILEKFKNNIT